MHGNGADCCTRNGGDEGAASVAPPDGTASICPGALPVVADGVRMLPGDGAVYGMMRSTSTLSAPLLLQEARPGFAPERRFGPTP